MKLVRFGAAGAEKPGILDKEGAIRDLSGVIADLDGSALSPASLDRLRALDVASLPKVPAGIRLGAPVAHVANLVCIGLNYTDHAEETGAAIPTQPIIFNKHTLALCGPFDDVILPPGSTKLDWEVELAIVIGKRCWHVTEGEAPGYVAGYSVMNDISERQFQIEWEGQWSKGKSYPTFAPMGPWLVTSDEVGDPQDLDLWLDLNGKREQTGTTRRMIFSCAHIVAYVSRFMALLPGDVITTGTPPGVGLGCKPPRFMVVGDKMSLGITKLGTQAQTVVPWSPKMAEDWRANG
jgi:2-keto-4-pentenoate hydratase/2-oxohepta-3-ene-1,7-dioic acid hydratase in catechol pathway